MKSTLILFILFSGSMLYGQTDSLERAILYKKLIDKEIRQDEFSKTWTSWNQAMKEIKKYPDLPLDQYGLVHYIYLYDFKGFDKEKLFNRTLEWLSINYGLIPSNVYSNKEDGKIIFRNSINLITGNTCTYAAIITLKNEKMLLEFINIGYQALLEGHYSNNTWVPERTIEYGINEVYPVILKKSTGWSSSLKLLETTNNFFKTEAEIIINYIITYDGLYSF
jgi:hypothetical protein